MIWFTAGVLFAFFNAMTMLVNQHYDLDGHFLSGARGIGVALLALPFVFFVAVPQSPLFWILALAEGLLSSFFNSRLYSSSAKFGAGATSRISILAVVFGVFLWWVIEWKSFLELCKYWIVLAGIIASLIAIITGALIMAKQEKSDSPQTGVSAMRYMMPAVVVLAIMMIVRKEIMQTAPFVSAAVYYCVVSIAISGTINLIIFSKRNSAKAIFEQFSKGGKTVVAASFAIAFSSAITILCGNISSYKAPDPAYVTAITLISPVVIIFFNRIAGVRDKFSLPAIILTFAGIGALIYFADIPLPPPTASVFSK